jgi:hypothetical protein
VTRVEANMPDVAPLRGGIPSDNNALESANNVDKLLLSRKKFAISEFIDHLGSDIIGPQSAADVQYNNKLKSRSQSSKKSFNKAPNNQVFYKYVWSQYQVYVKDPEKLSTLSSMQPISYAIPGYPKGMYWFLSDYGMERVKNEMIGGDGQDSDSECEYDPELWKDVKLWMQKHNHWVEVIQYLLTKPSEAHLLTSLTFDTLAMWLRSFHFLTPIKLSPDETDPTNMAVRNWCDMLSISGIGVISQEDIAKRMRRGVPALNRLFACSCEMYMHYMVCKHVFQLYLKSGIITKLPKGGTPMTKRGKKRKAHGGEALTFDL